MASGPPEMIQCGWKECQSWFSTGVDMNQHVLINHVKFMKIKFGEVDQAVVEPKKEEKSKVSEEPPAMRTFQPPPQPPLANWIAESRRMTYQSNLTAPPPPPASTPPKAPTFQYLDPMCLSTPNEERKQPFVHYYDVEDDEDDPEEVDAPASANPSEVSQVPEEPSSRKRSNGDDENEESGQDTAYGTSGASTSGSAPPKKSKPKPDGMTPKIPWALAQNASHIPQPEVRLSTSYHTIAHMAHAIREELSCRKTLRKKNHVNGNYCVVCLDYRRDSGFCEIMHNNQHDVFVKYWHTMFSKDRITKQNLLLQLQDMKKITDPLPPMSTNYYNSRAISSL